MTLCCGTGAVVKGLRLAGRAGSCSSSGIWRTGIAALAAAQLAESPRPGQAGQSQHRAHPLPLCQGTGGTAQCPHGSVCALTLLPLLAEQAPVSSFRWLPWGWAEGSSIHPGLTALGYPGSRAACCGCCRDSRGLQGADPGQKVHEVLCFSPPLLPCDLLFNCFVSSKEDDEQLLGFLPRGKGNVYFIIVFWTLPGFSSFFRVRT